MDSEKEVNLPKGLTVQRLHKLLRMFCIHAVEHEMGVEVDWKACNACILRDVPYTPIKAKSVSKDLKDLCYAIWHDGVLDKADG